MKNTENKLLLIKSIRLAVMVIKIVCQYDDKCSKPYKGDRGPDAIYKFIENLLKEQKKLTRNN